MSTRKKVGIITFQESNNFGAMLQAYALRKKVGDLGYDASIINYHCVNKESQYSTNLSCKRSFLVNINILLSKRLYAKSERLFNEFRKRYLHIDTVKIQLDGLEKLNNEYAAFICGSDQVWNPESTLNDSTYFLDFVNDARKRIAYAPSVGVSSIREQDREFFINGVKGITHLSVREKSAASIIQALTNRTPKVVVDPTLFLCKNDWEKLIGEPISREKYILFYNLDYTKQVVKEVKEIAKRMGLPVLMPARTIRDYKDGFKCYSWGPLEFLSAIKNAEYVLTTSFHGMMMSIIFHKDFLVFDKKASKNKLSSRIDDFLEMMNVKERKFTGDYGILTRRIDYDALDKRINMVTEESLRYLSDSLSNATLTVK